VYRIERPLEAVVDAVGRAMEDVGAEDLHRETGHVVGEIAPSGWLRATTRLMVAVGASPDEDASVTYLAVKVRYVDRSDLHRSLASRDDPELEDELVVAIADAAGTKLTQLPGPQDV
jgi:prolyl-tRNA editing enzyme YbaK/EbsC (Cys-tRNA(Pro) deacylase)